MKSFIHTEFNSASRNAFISFPFNNCFRLSPLERLSRAGISRVKASERASSQTGALEAKSGCFVVLGRCCCCFCFCCQSRESLLCQRVAVSRLAVSPCSRPAACRFMRANSWPRRASERASERAGERERAHKRELRVRARLQHARALEPNLHDKPKMDLRQQQQQATTAKFHPLNKWPPPPPGENVEITIALSSATDMQMRDPTCNILMSANSCGPSSAAPVWRRLLALEKLVVCNNLAGGFAD